MLLRPFGGNHLGDKKAASRTSDEVEARLVHKRMRSDVTLSWRLAQLLLLWRGFWEHSQGRISAALVSDTGPSHCWFLP
jgi:predicted transcriptional regulator